MTPANEADIQADMRELMQAQSFGAPTEAQRWGLTSQPQGQSEGDPSMAQLEIQADIARQNAAAMALQSLNPGQLPQGGDDAAHWRKLYGDSENAKGELRAQLERAEQEKAAQVETMNQLLLAMQQGSQRPGFGPAYQGQMQGVQQPIYGPGGFNAQPFDPFEGKSDDDLYSVKDAKRLLGEMISPALQAMQMQTMAALDRQNAAARRAAANITPLEEFTLTRENPWVNGLQSESQRIDALASIKRARSTTQPSPQATQANQAAQAAPIVRRMTTVEQGTQQAPDYTGNAVDSAYQRDFAAAMKLSVETGAQAKALRAVAEKYNIPIGRASDMGLMRTQTVI
jgi:hypothetical protein